MFYKLILLFITLLKYFYDFNINCLNNMNNYWQLLAKRFLCKLLRVMYIKLGVVGWGVNLNNWWRNGGVDGRIKES